MKSQESDRGNTAPLVDIGPLKIDADAIQLYEDTQMESDMKVILFEIPTIRGTCTVSRTVRGSLLRHSARAALSRIVDTLQMWRRRRRERIQLAMLDDRMLRDIGVSRADIWNEIHKPFWRK